MRTRRRRRPAGSTSARRRGAVALGELDVEEGLVLAVLQVAVEGEGAVDGRGVVIIGAAEDEVLGGEAADGLAPGSRARVTRAMTAERRAERNAAVSRSRGWSSMVAAAAVAADGSASADIGGIGLRLLCTSMRSMTRRITMHGTRGQVAGEISFRAMSAQRWRLTAATAFSAMQAMLTMAARASLGVGMLLVGAAPPLLSPAAASSCCSCWCGGKEGEDEAAAAAAAASAGGVSAIIVVVVIASLAATPLVVVVAAAAATVALVARCRAMKKPGSMTTASASALFSLSSFSPSSSPSPSSCSSASRYGTASRRIAWALGTMGASTWTHMPRRRRTSKRRFV